MYRRRISMNETQFVIFKLEKESYAIDIMKVQEITDFRTATAVPDAPDYIYGVINLRGNIVPIINLKKKLNIHEETDVENRRIVIVNINKTQVGVAVDDASQVLTLSADQIDRAPQAIRKKGTNLISGIGKSEDAIILIVDFESLINDKEFDQLQEVTV